MLCVAVDNYCERTSPSLSAEPLNAVSNAAFVIAAWAVWQLHRRNPHALPRGPVQALIGTIVFVGLGSFLFHTVGTRWAEWADVLPILLFMVLYLWLALTVFFGWPAWRKLFGLLLYFIVTFYLEAAVPATILWGGALYLPTLLVMAAIGIALARQNRLAARTFCAAVGVFILSFSARTLDSSLCPIFPYGTHFVWHLLNSALLYLLMKAAFLGNRTVSRTQCS